MIEEMIKGYIYVIEDEPNICKIGFSKSFPTTRQKQISCTYHKNFKLVGFFKSDIARLEEKEIHKKLEEYRIKGEWFKLSFQDIKKKFSYEFIENIELEELIDKKSKKEWMRILLRIKSDFIDYIDESIKDELNATRTSWILETIQERIKRESKRK